VRRTISRSWPVLLGVLLLAAAWVPVPAATLKPDPDGLPPHEVKDLSYGDVLFYFYQDDYFDAITRLLAAQQLNRVPNTQGEAELLLGGLYLSLGEHVEAGKIFDALLNANAPERVRNRAWFYLGQVWYKRGYLQRHMLLAQIMMREQRYDEAIALFDSWHGPPDWTAYADFNLGVALIRAGRLADAAPILNSVGLMNTRSEELLSLRDKANLALGFSLIQNKQAAEAKPILQRVRLEGPFSSKALLGVGWADANAGDFKHALIPWLALHKRNLLDSAVQESYIAVPYAYNQLGASGQAADYYKSAIGSFDEEIKHIDDSIESIRGGSLLDRLLGAEKNDPSTWYWQIKNLPSAPESRYLYELLADNEFQEGLKDYRELDFMSRNLRAWRESVSAFDDMLATREQAYAQRAPRADAVIAATDLPGLNRKRVDFESRINEIEKSNDVAALGTPEEQRTWARLKRIEDFLKQHPDDAELGEMREKHRLMKGVMYWRLSESFKARLWNERPVLVAQARQGMPIDTGGFAERVAAVRARMDQLQQRLAQVSDQQNHFLQSLAIRVLEDQKRRIEAYQLQARYELAAIYDRATNAKPKAQP